MTTEKGLTFPVPTGMPDGFRVGHPFSIVRQRKTEAAETIYTMRSFRTGAQIEVPELVGRTIMTVPPGGDASAIEFDELWDKLSPHMDPKERGGYVISRLIKDATAATRRAGTPIRTRNLDSRREIPFGIYFERPVFTLSDGTEVTPSIETNSEADPVMYVNRQDDLTTVMFLQDDGTVRSREFRNLPNNNRKTIVDYIIDHPDRIVSHEVAPHAKIEGIPTSFPIQVIHVRRDLDALYGGALFIPQLPTDGEKKGPRNKNYKLHATIINVNASPAELQDALGVQRPSTTVEEKRLSEIDPSLPMLHVLRGQDFAVAVVEQGDFRNTVTIRGKYKLAVFDYLVSHPKTPLIIGELAAATVPGKLPNTFATIVDRVRETLEDGLERNSLLASNMHSYKSTRTLATNITSIKPRDIASGELPYERLNDPDDPLAIVAVTETDNVIQMPSLFATALEHIPLGEENALDSLEICKHLWPDKDPSELNMNTVRSIIPKIIQTLKGQKPEIQLTKQLINSHWVSKYYFAEDNRTFTTRLAREEAVYPSLVGAIPLQEGVEAVLARDSMYVGERPASPTRKRPNRATSKSAEKPATPSSPQPEPLPPAIPELEPLPQKGSPSFFTIGSEGEGIEITNSDLTAILQFFIDEVPVNRTITWLEKNLQRQAKKLFETMERGNLTLAEHGIRLQWKPAKGGWGLYDNAGRQVTLNQAADERTE